MKKRPLFIIAILVPIILFLITIAYWTILPRTATLDIPGEGIYTGQLRGMTFHGYGTYESYVVGGTSYEGEWKNGVFHGQGTLTFANGSKLVGEFVDGSIHGIGRTICPDGHVIEVDFGEGTQVDGCSGCDHAH
ncbi:MAG: hypothetical protein U1E11_06025 [Dethiobacteria bacterium]|nr:hypothetical protein [Dethiobacteria bacterium]